jgi:hypothetical protein
MNITDPRSISQTPVRFSRQGETEFIIKTDGVTSMPSPDELVANTRAVNGLFSRFGTYVLPLAIAAAFAAPGVGHIRRRTRSEYGSANSDVLDAFWFGDGWTYTEEPADYAHVLLLDDLLSLRTAEGLVLDLSE